MRESHRHSVLLWSAGGAGASSGRLERSCVTQEGERGWWARSTTCDMSELGSVLGFVSISSYCLLLNKIISLS